MRPTQQLLWQADPVAFARDALDFECDPWQCDVLRSKRDTLLLLHRQSGKTTATSILALHTAKFQPGSLTLLLAPSQRQSKEQFQTIRRFMRRLEPIEVLESNNAMSCEMANGSRIVSLPGADPNTIRGYSAPQLLIEDEAAWVSDDTHEAAAPMLLVSKGRNILMSTPGGTRGHFYEHWISANDDWQRIKLSVLGNPRIDTVMLEKLRKKTPAWRWRAEYLVEFLGSHDQLFSDELIESAFYADVKPVFSPAQLAAILA
jgi:hypothetical protein